jgi:peptidoglycan/LPS O-acetylase OafA/YrhL
MVINQRSNNNFDFLRILGALCTIFTHSFGLLGLYNKEYLAVLSDHRISFGYVGLCIFFSVSGYLIAKSAVTSTSFINYLWKRFLRVQPLLIVVCLLSVFIVGPVFTSLSQATYFENLSSYTYFRNIMPVFGIQYSLPGVFKDTIGSKSINGSMWTLVVDERLYLFVGILFLMKHKSKSLFLWLVGILNMIFFLKTFIFHKQMLSYLNGLDVLYALIFLNAACYFLLSIDFTKISRSVLYFFGGLLVLSVTLYIPFTESILVLVTPFLIIMVAHLKGFLNHAGRYGDFTYGIYIFSFPVQQILITMKLADTPIKLFFLTLAIVLPLAIVSWHLLEKKMMLLKQQVK